MADITKIKVSGTDYTIKDDGAARSDHTHAYKPSFNKSIYHNAGGNPHAIKFITVDYSGYGSEKGAYFKLDATCCHGNGISYQFLEEVIAGVNQNGDVSLAVNKSCQIACSSVDGRSSYYGDVFAVKDTTNKKVYFYILGGQWCQSLYTDLTPIGSATVDGVTQHTGNMSTYSSGTKIWAQGCGSTCHDYLPKAAFSFDSATGTLTITTN